MLEKFRQQQINVAATMSPELSLPSSDMGIIPEIWWSQLAMPGVVDCRGTDGGEIDTGIEHVMDLDFFEDSWKGDVVFVQEW